MNVERLEHLAVWLEGGAKHERLTFHMEKGLVIDDVAFQKGDIAECGTTCCIAGAATQFFATPEQLQMWLTNTDGELHYADENEFGTGDAEIDWQHVYTIGMNLLDLTENQAYALFVPNEGRAALDDFNDPIWAARVIRRLIETGEVNWAATEPAPAP